MILDPLVPTIYGDNISQAWANAFVQCLESPDKILHSAVVRINVANDGKENEIPEIRKIVDTQLRALLKKTGVQNVVKTVAGTIFPESIWQLAKGDRHQFYREYEKALPFIRHKLVNRRGTYFQRMIAFSSTDDKTINQLEFIINTWNKGNHRHSALQAGIFDPRNDHSNSRRLGFPCLQQVVFYPNGSNGKDGLSVIAFYATQTLAEKAYGNYLGLYHLGLFMAKEMGLQLKEVVCVASALKLSDSSTINKTVCDPIAGAIRAVLKNA